jgi:hypothetical protein
MSASDRRGYVTVHLTRAELRAAASAGLAWATELRADALEADRWLKRVDEWSFERVSYPLAEKQPHCPMCYRPVGYHGLDDLIHCGKKHRIREACDHDWAYDFMGGDICRKCGAQT